MEAKTLNIRKADKKDLSLIQDMIKLLAAYEQRPQDMTATKEMLSTGFLKEKSPVF